MKNSLSASEPPSKCACHIDIQCQYADINVPGDSILCEWAEKSIHYLVDKNLLKSIDVEMAVLVVDKGESQLLNSEYRQQDKPTNVLSFPFETPDIFKSQQQTRILGDIIICAPIIEAEAQQQNKTLQQHWAHMLVHGILHLLGYDHIEHDDAKTMEYLEVKILDQLGYPNPYMELPHE